MDHVRVDVGPYRLAAQGTAVVSNPCVHGVGSAAGIRPDPVAGSVAPGTSVTGLPLPDGLQPEHTQIGLAMANLGEELLYVNSDADPTSLYRLASIHRRSTRGGDDPGGTL